ncbi:MAG: SUMF1/EgtB/PvdO family nonheme iron enzyme [Gemmatimonadota bacterium]|nr:SUMF1/EgtB/PvdO family nonheme iron enzyme [Gemmatimonadota bacterium]
MGSKVPYPAALCHLPAIFRLIASSSVKLTRISAAKTLLPALLLLLAARLTLPASIGLTGIVPSSAKAGDLVLAEGESFGSYVMYSAGDSRSASRVVLLNVPSAGPSDSLECTILSWEYSRVVFAIPDEALMDKRYSAGGYPVCDTLLFYTAGDPSPFKLPYLVHDTGTIEVDNLEVVNITSTSATVRWSAKSIGPDSLVLGLGEHDILDITTLIFKQVRDYSPAFVTWIPPGVSGNDSTPEFSGSLSLETIPAGNFEMGSNEQADEQPIHTITLSSFQISTYEITQAEYLDLMGVNPSAHLGDLDYPVEQVEWYDAVTFCNKLSEKDGLAPCYNLATWNCNFNNNGYRLPTEAEWEHACRAETTTKYYTGDNPADLAQAGWYNGNSGNITHTVGQKTPNDFGLYDTHGNVWEWVNDRYTANYYATSPGTDPTGPGSPWPVQRGGAYNTAADDCRSANRNFDWPNAPSPSVGFRVARRGAFDLAGNIDAVYSAVQVFQSDRSVLNGMHQVVLTGLLEDRLYKFFIGLSGGKYLADRTRNVGGAYNPVIIGRTDENQNGLLDAFAFRTSPMDIPGGGEEYSLTGSISSPVLNGRASVFLVSAQNPADTSTTIGALIDRNKNWVISLKSLRLLRRQDRFFLHQEGDHIFVTIDAGNDGFDRFEALRGPPGITVQQLGEQSVQPVVSFPEKIAVGNNMLSVPVLPTTNQPITAVYLLEQVPGGSTSLSRYLSDRGIFQTCYHSGTSTDKYSGENFQLQPGESYILSTSLSTEITWRGAKYGSDLPSLEFPCAGLHFFSRPLQTDTLAIGWDSYALLHSVNEIKEVFTWDSRYQKYQGAFRRLDGDIQGQRFSLRPGGGYIARTTDQASWDPNQPPPVNYPALSSADPAQSAANRTEHYPAAAVVQAGHWQTVAGPGDQPVISDLTANSFTLLAREKNLNLETLQLPRGAELEALEIGGFTQVVCSGLPRGYRFRAPGCQEQLSLARDVSLLRRPGLVVYGTLTSCEGNPLACRPVWIGTPGRDSNTLLAFSDSAGNWWVNLANLPGLAAGLNAGSDSPVLLRVTTVRDKSTLLQAEISLDATFPARLELITKSSVTESMSERAGNNTIFLPRAFTLGQNYPNPFNPQTSIDFTIPDLGVETLPVSLEVFSLRGRRVKTLLFSNLGAGRYSVVWDGRDETGRQASSGVYLYRLSLPGSSLTRKMVLLK